MLMGDDVEPTTPWETFYVVIVVLIGACVNATMSPNVSAESLVPSMALVRFRPSTLTRCVISRSL